MCCIMIYYRLDSKNSDVNIGFPLYVPKHGFWEGFEGEDVKILSSDPQKALPCVNTRLLMYRMSKSVQRPEF